MAKYRAKPKKLKSLLSKLRLGPEYPSGSRSKEDINAVDRIRQLLCEEDHGIFDCKCGYKYVYVNKPSARVAAKSSRPPPASRKVAAAAKGQYTSRPITGEDYDRAVRTILSKSPALSYKRKSELIQQAQRKSRRKGTGSSGPR